MVIRTKRDCTINRIVFRIRLLALIWVEAGYVVMASVAGCLRNGARVGVGVEDVRSGDTVTEANTSSGRLDCCGLKGS